MSTFFNPACFSFPYIVNHQALSRQNHRPFHLIFSPRTGGFLQASPPFKKLISTTSISVCSTSTSSIIFQPFRQHQYLLFIYATSDWRLGVWNYSESESQSTLYSPPFAFPLYWTWKKLVGFLLFFFICICEALSLPRPSSEARNSLRSVILPPHTINLFQPCNGALGELFVGTWGGERVVEVVEDIQLLCSVCARARLCCFLSKPCIYDSARRPLFKVWV